MKDIFYNIVLLALLYGGIQNSHAQVEASKKIEQSFEFSNTGELQLENKYGNIIVNGWDKDMLEITIDIVVTKKEKEDARQLLDRIQPSFTNTGDFIKAVTVIEEKRNNIFTKLWNQTNPFDFDKGNIKIDYTIFIPVKTEIEISNKFGDIILSNWKGKLKTTLHHGDIWIKDELINASIDLKFGKLQATSINYAFIQLKNGELELEKSKDLRIYSSGSTLNISEATDLEIDSNKDKTSIKQTDRIRGALKFSNLRLENLGESIDLNLEVSDLLVNRLEKSDPSILIRQKSSEIQMNISSLSFDFAAHLEQGVLRIPTSFTNITTNIVDEKKRVRDIKASYGTGNPGKFKLTGEKGVIILKEN